jgi:hypothetical protein
LDVQQGLNFFLIMKSNVSQAMVEALTLACENVNMIIVNPFTCI